MTIHGWDASHYDWQRGPVDVGAAVRAGISFAVHKATEGGSYLDPRFAAFVRAAHPVVPLCGAYHVLHSGNTTAQVRHFVDVLDHACPWWRGGPFLIQLDCERWATDFPGPGDIHAWCTQFAAQTGGTHRVVVYASRGQYGHTLYTVDCPLWNAAYPTSRAAGYRALYPGDGHPAWAPYSGRTPVIWQYSSTATIGQPQCDANAFRGTLAALRALTLTAPPTAPQGAPVAPPVALTDTDWRVFNILTLADPGKTAGNPVPHEGNRLAQTLREIQDALAAAAARDTALATAVAALTTQVGQIAATAQTAAQTGAQAGVGASQEAFTAAVLAQLQDHTAGLTGDDVQNAVRAVFAAAATPPPAAG